MDRLLSQSDKVELWVDVKRRQAEREEGRSLASPVKKKQKLVQQKEPSQQRRKQRIRKRNQEMEL